MILSLEIAAASTTGAARLAISREHALARQRIALDYMRGSLSEHVEWLAARTGTTDQSMEDTLDAIVKQQQIEAKEKAPVDAAEADRCFARVHK